MDLIRRLAVDAAQHPGQLDTSTRVGIVLVALGALALLWLALQPTARRAAHALDRYTARRNSSGPYILTRYRDGDR